MSKLSVSPPRNMRIGKKPRNTKFWVNLRRFRGRSKRLKSWNFCILANILYALENRNFLVNFIEILQINLICSCYQIVKIWEFAGVLTIKLEKNDYFKKVIIIFFSFLPKNTTRWKKFSNRTKVACSGCLYASNKV